MAIDAEARPSPSAAVDSAGVGGLSSGGSFRGDGGRDAWLRFHRHLRGFNHGRGARVVELVNAGNDREADEKLGFEHGDDRLDVGQSRKPI